jgi:DNA-binding transcriptional LysR family regulator
LEIRDLNYFRAVVEAGGLTRAASVLHITPGALSKALRRFEDEAGRELFARRGRTLVLTDAGERLYRSSARLVEEHQRLLAEIEADRDTPDTTLRIATFEVFSTYALAAMLEQPTLTGSTLQVLDVGVAQITEAVLDREVDLGITYVPFPHRELRFQRVAELEFGIYARRGAFVGDSFASLPFAIPTSRLQLASGELLGIDCWPSARIPRRVAYRLTMLETALALVRRGQAVVFIPHFIARLHDEVTAKRYRLRRIRAPKGLGVVRRTAHLVTRQHWSHPTLCDDVASALATVVRSPCATGDQRPRLTAATST